MTLILRRFGGAQTIAIHLFMNKFSRQLIVFSSLTDEKFLMQSFHLIKCN